MSIKNLTRKESRKHIFALVFQLSFYEDIDIDEMLSCYIEEQELVDISDNSRQFIYDEFKGTYTHLEELDKIISDNLKGWTLNRLNKVDLAVLRLALYEIIYGDIPKSVAINEGIEISKTYSSDEAPNFINGVLGTIAKDM